MVTDAAKNIICKDTRISNGNLLALVNGSETALHSHAAGGGGGGAAYGEYSDEDSDGNAMLAEHAYLAAQDGFVTCEMSSVSGIKWVSGFLGATDDPVGAGDKIQYASVPATGHGTSIGFQVAAGTYFEFTLSSPTTNKIYWHPVGTLSKPVDQEAP